MESALSAADHFQQFLLIRQTHLLRLHPEILDHLLILQGVLVIRFRAELSSFYHIYLLCHLFILNYFIETMQPITTHICIGIRFYCTISENYCKPFPETLTCSPAYNRA